MIRGWSKLGGALLVLLLLVGCAKGSGHLTIHLNGSADVAITLDMDARVEKLAGSGTVDKFMEKITAESGLTFTKKQVEDTVSYSFNKSYSSLQEMRDALGGDADWLKGGEGAFETTVKKGWFIDRYTVAGTLDLSNYTGSLLADSGLPDMMLRMLEQQFSLDLKLTLPIDLIGEHSGTGSGRTVTWRISLSEPTPIYATIYVPSVTAIVLAVVFVLLLLVAAVYAIRRRRNNRRSKPPQPPFS